jgi:DNA-binding XRE family transcriptional regulator
MHDADTECEAVADNGRAQLRRTLYLAACAKRGALRQEDRAALFDLSRRFLDRYEWNRVEPRLSTAMRIASRLDMTVHELWEPAA